MNRRKTSRRAFAGGARRRRGTSLIELLLVIAVSGVLLAMMCTLVGAMLRGQTLLGESAARERALGRLSLALRRDAHAAVDAGVESPAGASQSSKLTLALGNGMIVEYHGLAGRVERIAKRGDAIVHREAFQLSDDRQAHLASVLWTVDVAEVDIVSNSQADPRSPRNVMMAIDWRSAVEPASFAPARRQQIKARVGRDQATTRQRKPGEQP